MLPKDIAKILVGIWKDHCKERDFVFLSKKDPVTGKWIDRAFVYNSEIQSKLTEWIGKNSPEKYNLYFCPLPFISPSRQKRFVRGSKYLWSDLDEVDISRLPIRPSHYWESSPGRFQGLWTLDKFISSKNAETLNKELTYAMGADTSGWDLTQVLRIPGTRNHKYGGSPKVGEIVSTGEVYEVGDLSSKLPEGGEEDYHQGGGTFIYPDLDARKVLAKYRAKIPRKVLGLLLTKSTSVGKRSDIIWYLENKLMDIGLTPPEIFTHIKHSKWNKYEGRADEDERLRIELEKIIEGKVTSVPESTYSPPADGDDSSLGLVIEDYQDFMGGITQSPGWLVEGFWSRRSHGVVAGEPKAFKSILTLDLAVSVASGTPFLGQFPVLEPGPVIIVQNENAEWIMKDRMHKIIVSKGLVGDIKVEGRKLVGKFPPKIPIHFINQQSFNFNDPIHREVIERAIEEIRPVLVIFDPLYLMFDGEVNSAKDLNPVLNWLLRIKTEYRTGIVVIHHWNKGGSSPRGGQRMLGSVTLHGWVESAWYIKFRNSASTSDDEDEVDDADIVDRPSGKPVDLTIEREFRGAGTYKKVDLTIKLGSHGETLYNIDIKTHIGRGRSSATEDLASQITHILSMSNRFVSQRRLAEETAAGRRAIKKVLDSLEEKGVIEVSNRGAKLVDKKSE